VPFAVYTRVGPRNHALNGVNIGVTWRIRLNVSGTRYRATARHVAIPTPTYRIAEKADFFHGVGGGLMLKPHSTTLTRTPTPTRPTRLHPYVRHARFPGVIPVASWTTIVARISACHSACHRNNSRKSRVSDVRILERISVSVSVSASWNSSLSSHSMMPTTTSTPTRPTRLHPYVRHVRFPREDPRGEVGEDVVVGDVECGFNIKSPREKNPLPLLYYQNSLTIC